MALFRNPGVHALGYLPKPLDVVVLKSKRTNQEIAELAEKVYRGDTFVSFGLNPEQIRTCFMPLLLCDKKLWSYMKHNSITTFYAPMSHALPRSINGLPCFGGMNMLDKKDGIKLKQKMIQMQKAIDAIKGGKTHAEASSEALGDQ